MDGSDRSPALPRLILTAVMDGSDGGSSDKGLDFPVGSLAESQPLAPLAPSTLPQCVGEVVTHIETLPERLTDTIAGNLHQNDQDDHRERVSGVGFQENDAARAHESGQVA